MSDRKRYGTYEQVNGGTLNDAYDEIERLQSQLDQARETIDQAAQKAQQLVVERDQWKEYADAGLESYKKDQAEIARLQSQLDDAMSEIATLKVQLDVIVNSDLKHSVDTFRERWKAEQAKRVAVETRNDSLSTALANIMRHAETMSPSEYKWRTDWNIAKQAIEGRGIGGHGPACICMSCEDARAEEEQRHIHFFQFEGRVGTCECGTQLVPPDMVSDRKGP